MPKPEYEFHTPDSPWRSLVASGSIQEQILSVDHQTGEYTRLMRFDPGADSTELGAQVHDFWEEVFIVDGELTDLKLQQTFESGMYACRPPGMEHGPWRSKRGCLMVEFRYGFTK